MYALQYIDTISWKPIMILIGIAFLSRMIYLVYCMIGNFHNSQWGIELICLGAIFVFLTIVIPQEKHYTKYIGEGVFLQLTTPNVAVYKIGEGIYRVEIPSSMKKIPIISPIYGEE